LTTIRRLALPLFVFLAWTPAAYAWSWPVQGPVLQPFSYDEAHPYASGQHRGIDIGAGSAGESVVAPAAGTVSFAGSVPTNGKSVTIETADGYSVTLTHLGSITVVEGGTVAEQDAIGTVGPSGTPEEAGPYVHLGIRLTADPNGYVDPLGLLPPASGDGATQSGSVASPPATSGAASSAAPARKPAAPAPKSRRPAATGRGRVRVHQHQHQHQRAQEPRSDARTTRSRHRPVLRTQQDRAREQMSSSRRPVVEPAAPEPIGLDAGHAIRPAAPAAQARREPSNPLLELMCNWAAALFALGAAFAADRRRRRSNTSPTANPEVLHLPRIAAGHGRFSRAA
jgi:hypothetical protein